MNDWEQRMYHRLRARLQRDVPTAIRNYLSTGGPCDEDCERVRAYAHDLGTFGDVLLFPDGKGNDEPHLKKLVDGVAALAFCPGGIHLFDLHFDAARIEQQLPPDATEPGEDLHHFLAALDQFLIP